MSQRIFLAACAGFTLEPAGGKLITSEVNPGVPVEPEPKLDRRARRLAIDRRRLRLREIELRLKAEYHAAMAEPFPNSLCDLLEKLEIIPAQGGNSVPK